MLLLFNYYPAVQGIRYAFQDVNPGISSRFVGLRNFEQMAHDFILLRSCINMVILVVAALIKSTVFPLFVALMIFHLISDRARYFFQSLFLFPIVVPGIVGVLLWRNFIFDPNVGLINEFLGAVGIPGLERAWLGEHSTALPSLIFTGFPWIAGVGFLIFFAGLLGISQSVLESAVLDGVGPAKRFFYIELPLLLGQLRLVIVLTFISSLQDFGGVLLMTGGGPGEATHIPALHMYYMAFRFDQYGYAAAIGVTLFIVIFALTFINLKLIRSNLEE